KFEHPKKSFKPRARPEGEAARDARPKRAFKPREDQLIDKPRGARAVKPRDGGAPRGERAAGGSKRGAATRRRPPRGARPPRPGAGPAGGRGSPRGPRSKGGAMRIVAGSLKGRAIVAPEGQATRPTSDRARQAVFNVLEHAAWAEPLDGARIIDLYAGSGAM